MAISTKAQRRVRRSKLMAEINVTPMVDVMLVLLVIFMVAAPMLQVGVPVNLPDGEVNALPQEAEIPLAISVASNGDLFLQNELVADADLAARLDEAMEDRNSRKVYLRADGANSYGKVFEVMGLLSGAGYTDIGLVGDVPTSVN